MKCQTCNVEMEKGLLTGDAQHWVKEQSISGMINKRMNFAFGWGYKKVRAYACPQCDIIVLRSK